LAPQNYAGDNASITTRHYQDNADEGGYGTGLFYTRQSDSYIVNVGHTAGHNGTKQKTTRQRTRKK
jgi:hypothetical protein